MSVREVTGRDERLVDLIDSGEVERPELVDYLGWVSWRAAAGGRPARRRGDGVSTTSAQEAALWRAIMEHVHGEDWRQELADRQAEAAQAAWLAEEEGDGTSRGLGAVGAVEPPALGAGGSVSAGALVPGDTTLAVAPAGAGIRTPDSRSDASSEFGSPAALRAVLEREFDPDRESREAWQTRTLRMVAHLERIGEPLAEEDLQRIVRKAGYAENLRGRSLSEQVAFLKKTFGEVLLDEESFDEVEYNARLAALMQMLRSRGTEMSASVHRMFSGVGSVSASARGSPERERTAAAAEPTAEEAARAERVILTPPKKSDELRILQEQVAAMRARLERLDSTDRGVAGVSSTTPDQVLAKAIEMQTEAIAQALKAKETRHSTIKVSPTFKWPTLGDDGPDSKEVEEFYDKYEDLCRLANDGRGMNPTEHLTTLCRVYEDRRKRSTS